MLDSMGKRYGKLPSEVLENASTFDLWVFDVSVSYRNYVEERELAKHDPNKAFQQQDYDPEELKQKLEKFRENRGSR